MGFISSLIGGGKQPKMAQTVVPASATNVSGVEDKSTGRDVADRNRRRRGFASTQLDSNKQSTFG